jgi:hypothetical protein
LAAVQQNKWATGVVSPNKGTSIASVEEKPKSYSGNGNNSSPPHAPQIRRKPNFDENSVNSSNSNNANYRRSNLNNTTNANANNSNNPNSSTKLPFVPEASLYISGVIPQLKSEDIRAEFAALGSLAHFDVKYNSGAAFVEYTDSSIAKILLEEGGIVVNGTRLTVEKRRIASRHSHASPSFNDGNKEKKFTQTTSNRRDRPNKTPAAVASA